MIKIFGTIAIIAVLFLSSTLSNRHMVYQWSRVLYYFDLKSRFEKESLCQSDETAEACAVKIISESSGFKFGRDFDSALAVVVARNQSSVFFARYISGALSAFNPGNLWIAKKEGAIANTLLSQELDELTAALQLNRATILNGLTQSTDSVLKSEYIKLLLLIDSKIKEMHDLHRLL